MLNKTNRDRYLCLSCGGVSVYLTPVEAEQERKEGHEIETYPKAPEVSEVRS